MPRAHYRYHNISVDAETHAALTDQQKRLERQWGFKPSLAQVIRHFLFSGATAPEEPSWDNPDGPTAA